MKIPPLPARPVFTDRSAVLTVGLKTLIERLNMQRVLLHSLDGSEKEKCESDIQLLKKEIARKNEFTKRMLLRRARVREAFKPFNDWVIHHSKFDRDRIPGIIARIFMLASEFENGLQAPYFVFKSTARKDFANERKILIAIRRKAEKLGPFYQQQIFKIVDSATVFKFPSADQDKAMLIKLCIPLAKYLMGFELFNSKKQSHLYPLLASLCNSFYGETFRFEESDLHESEIRLFTMHLKF